MTGEKRKRFLVRMVVAVVRLRRRRCAAALTRSTLVATLKQAGVRLADTTRFAGDTACWVGVPCGGALRAVQVLVSGVGAATVVMLGVETELGLDGGRVDTVGVQAAADGQCQLHVASRAFSFEVELDLDVQATNKFGVAELPDVDVVAGNDTRKVFDVGLDVVNVDAGGDSLEENARGGLAERNSRCEDNCGDDERDHRIHIEAPGVVGEPDEECDSDDTNVAKGVAQDVKEDTAHVEVSVRVATLRLLLGLRVPVLVVVDGLALGASVPSMLAAQKGLVRRSVSVSVVCVVHDVLVLGVVFGLKVLHASGCNDRLAESARVDMDVIESGVPRARSTVPTL